MTGLAALIWIFLCSAAGATPNRWHRAIAYMLMLAALPILWLLWHDAGPLWAAGFFVLALFQLRLLLIHWAKRLYRHVRDRADA